MSEPIILSDEEDQNALETPIQCPYKKIRTGPHPVAPTVLILDDDPTPKKSGFAPSSSSTPSFVAETPMSDVCIIKCTSRSWLDPQIRVSNSDENLAGSSRLVCLESDNECESGSGRVDLGQNELVHSDSDDEKDSEWDLRIGNAGFIQMSGDSSSQPTCSEYDMDLEEKLRKAALKAEAAESKKLQKEMQKWAKGKFAQDSIVTEIDAKVVELGSVGGHLLTRFAEKRFKYRIASNPIERSIVWTMPVPEHISQISPQGMEIPYILLIYEAEEFCNLVLNESLMDHVSLVRRHYPSHTICYLTNREKERYKNPANNSGWRRPPVEEVLAKLTTHFFRVHSRQCIDEAEVAEHVVGLTSSLASCQFRKKLTRLSVNANGSLISKDSVDKNLIKKSPWLKALVSIPKVQPRYAIAIWKKYPTMKALLSIYMDPSKSVHEKEFLLKDLTVDGLLGDNRKLGEVCSKRVYRILIAQSGSIKTDDIEDGADFFRCQSN
ncbi:Crossover junction endonuclease EME1B [Citrus sinensis]|uniref:Crossover junction endonuclease EME1B n=1 Tax=Citrus sinensis TaxID=2711 RepID=A0ACB8JJ83_CITSI|nr:Crossover junction endonuclease EME1B [Citrus sinensis]